MLTKGVHVTVVMLLYMTPCEKPPHVSSNLSAYWSFFQVEMFPSRGFYCHIEVWGSSRKKCKHSRLVSNLQRETHVDQLILRPVWIVAV